MMRPVTAGDQFRLRSYSHSFRKALGGTDDFFFIFLFLIRRFEWREISLLTDVLAGSLAALTWLTAVLRERGGCRRAAALDGTDDGCRPFPSGAAGGGVTAISLALRGAGHRCRNRWGWRDGR